MNTTMAKYQRLVDLAYSDERTQDTENACHSIDNGEDTANETHGGRTAENAERWTETYLSTAVATAEFEYEINLEEQP